jgi:Leucine-rich repeat (LRR) protein
LQELRINQNKFQKFFALKAEKLTKLVFDVNPWSDISEISNCVLPLLEDFRVEGCDFSSNPILPKIDMPSLKSLYLKNNSINDISNLEFSNLPALEDLNLSKNKITKLPKMNLPIIKFFRMNLN